MDLVHRAIAAGVFGQILWNDKADERARNDPDLLGLTPEGVRRLLRDFVLRGGQLDQWRGYETGMAFRKFGSAKLLSRFLVPGRYSDSRPVSQWSIR